MTTVSEIRGRTQMSRYALAQAVGMSYQGLSRIEGGRVEPRLKTLQRISSVLAEKLGVPAAEVLSELTAPPVVKVTES
ncbi:transcriptional regulator with XRE-family HTH domain [Deinococcus sp. UYEF24]